MTRDDPALRAALDEVARADPLPHGSGRRASDPEALELLARIQRDPPVRRRRAPVLVRRSLAAALAVLLLGFVAAAIVTSGGSKPASRAGSTTGARSEQGPPSAAAPGRPAGQEALRRAHPRREVRWTIDSRRRFRGTQPPFIVCERNRPCRAVEPAARRAEWPPGTLLVERIGYKTATGAQLYWESRDRAGKDRIPVLLARCRSSSGEIECLPLEDGAVVPHGEEIYRVSPRLTFPDPDEPAVLVDERAGALGGMRLGTSAAALRSRLGDETDEEEGFFPAGTVYTGPPRIPAPTKPGRPAERPQEQPYEQFHHGDQAYLVSPFAGVFAMATVAAGARTAFGARVGDDLAVVRHRYEHVTCGEAPGGERVGGGSWTYPWCRATVGRISVFFGGDPIRSITLTAATPASG